MKKARIERTFFIGDALAMRPLRKIPAGILLPLAELILGNREFRSIAMERPGAHGSQREPYSLQANCARTVFQRKTVWFACEPWTPQAFEKA